MQPTFLNHSFKLRDRIKKSKNLTQLIQGAKEYLEELSSENKVLIENESLNHDIILKVNPIEKAHFEIGFLTHVFDPKSIQSPKFAVVVGFDKKNNRVYYLIQDNNYGLMSVNISQKENPELKKSLEHLRALGYNLKYPNILGAFSYRNLGDKDEFFLTNPQESQFENIDEIFEIEKYADFLFAKHNRLYF